MKMEFICARFDNPDRKLKQFADENNTAFYVHPNINSDEFKYLILPDDCDIFVSMSFKKIFKAPIINLHPRKQSTVMPAHCTFIKGEMF